MYSSCTISLGTVIITFADDISPSTSIEVYFDDAVTLSSTFGVKNAVIKVIAKWHSVTISETKPDADFTINAAPTATLTSDSSTSIDISNTAAGENSNYTFTFIVDTTLEYTH